MNGPAPCSVPGLPPPDVLIACSDARFARMLEIEADLMGLRSLRVPLPLPAGRALAGTAAGASILLLDLDEAAPLSPLPDGLSLIGWSRDPDGLTCPLPEGAVVLRRPFALEELHRALARFSALPEYALRPSPPPALPPQIPAPAPAAPSPEPRLTPSDHEGAVRLDGKDVPLTPSEWAVWASLTANPGEIVPRETLRALIAALPGVRSVGGNAVDVCVCRLRAKVEKPTGLRIITAVRGEGYRFEEKANK